MVSGMKRSAILLKARRLAFPDVDVARREYSLWKRSVDDGARLGQRPDSTGGEHLHGDVAKSRRLDRARGDGDAGRIGRQLVQQRVLRSPADHTDALDRATSHRLEVSDDHT